MLLSYLPFYTFRLLAAGGGELAEAQQNFSTRFEGRWLYNAWLKPAFYLPGKLGIAWAALITVIGRIAGGDFLRGLYYLKNHLKVKTK
jgi:hypothetical protein